MKEGHISVNNLFFEYLDLERKKDPEHYKNLVTLLRHKYAKEKIDLIVTVHTPALRFLLNEGRDLFRATPALSYLGPDTIETAGTERRFLAPADEDGFRGTWNWRRNCFPRRCGLFSSTESVKGRRDSSVRPRPFLRSGVTIGVRVHQRSKRGGDASADCYLPLGPSLFTLTFFTDKTGRTFVAKMWRRGLRKRPTHRSSACITPFSESVSSVARCSVSRQKGVGWNNGA